MIGKNTLALVMCIAILGTVSVDARVRPQKTKATEKRAPAKTELPRNIQGVETELLHYNLTLQARGAEMGVPPTRMAQISTQIEAILWSNVMAGVPEDQALAAARAYGEQSLILFNQEKETFSLITGKEISHENFPPIGDVGAIEVHREQRKEQ